jgi:Ser/Thr protein kinase RdoA (MazF antagonist)
MENRVYEIEVDRPDEEIQSPSDQFIVAKFYRPGRWTKEQILDEHSFLLKLAEAELPVVAPMVFDGESLFQTEEDGILYALFPKKGGRIEQEYDIDQLEMLGRLLARVHAVGRGLDIQYRLTLNPETFGFQNMAYLETSTHLPSHLKKAYLDTAQSFCEAITPLFEGVHLQPIHGDCHLGNVIWRAEQGPFLVDFDDMTIGPKVQDIWLIIPGQDQQANIDRQILLEAYQTMADFNQSELKLIEPLRGLRYIHFAAWMAKRWDDPAFKRAFPFFGSDRYWEGQIQDLKLQRSKTQGQQSSY